MLYVGHNLALIGKYFFISVYNLNVYNIRKLNRAIVYYVMYLSSSFKSRAQRCCCVYIELYGFWERQCAIIVGFSITQAPRVINLSNTAIATRLQNRVECSR